MAKKRKPASASRTKRSPAPKRVAGAKHSGARTKGVHALLIVLAQDNATLDRVVTALIDLGIQTTVIESKPLSTVLRTELPIFSGLASLLPPTPDGRLLLSVTTATLADRAVRLLSGGDARPRFLGTIALRSLVTLP